MGKSAPLLAVLIDADNISAKYSQAIFEEITTLGEASLRRIYGDFSGNGSLNWNKEILAALGIVPQQQFANTAGKNASDITLVIDAMDIMHTGRFDGFVLISSDSDFTRLASRIREQGLDVYGMGETKTPEAFRMACKRFIYVENIGHTLNDSGNAPNKAIKASTADLNRAYQRIANVIADTADENGWMRLDRLGQQLIDRYPDFDSRSYGYKQLSNLIRKIDRLDVEELNGNLSVKRKGN